MSTAHATKLGNWQMVYSWKGALSVGDVQVAYQIKKSFCFFGFFFILMVFWATFEQMFREITGNVLENLEQLGESPTGGAIWLLTIILCLLQC